VVGAKKNITDNITYSWYLHAYENMLIHPTAHAVCPSLFQSVRCLSDREHVMFMMRMQQLLLSSMHKT